MVYFNDTKTFSEAFQNLNCQFLFGYVMSLSCDLYSTTLLCQSKLLTIQINLFQYKQIIICWVS